MGVIEAGGHPRTPAKGRRFAQPSLKAVQTVDRRLVGDILGRFDMKAGGHPRTPAKDEIERRLEGELGRF